MYINDHLRMYTSDYALLYSLRFTRKYISVNQHRSKQQCRNTFLK